MGSVRKSHQTAVVYGQDIHENIIPPIHDDTFYCRDPLTEEITEIYSAINDLKAEEIYQEPSDQLKTVFQRLDDLIVRDVDDRTIEEILCNFDDMVLDTITRFRSLYTVRLEIEHAKAILESEDPWRTLKDFDYFSNYLQLARTEYEGSMLKVDDCVIFLGSGPLPLSLIVLCDQYGLRGIGIEEEPDRAELSRRVLEKLGLSDQIEIINGNHFRLPLDVSFERIMVAAQAEPKKEIFDHLAKVLHARTKISYRIYEKGLRRLLDTFSRYELPEQFEAYKRSRPEPPVNNTVVFLNVIG